MQIVLILDGIMMRNKLVLNVTIIVQARMGSSRLPGKTMKTIFGRPLLSFLVERLQQSKCHHRIIVATTNLPADRQIVDFCRSQGIDSFVGSESDVLDRYFAAAHAKETDLIVRVTGDCPLIDPGVVDEAIHCFIDHYPDYDYVSNVIERTYPRGLDVEVFSKKCLQVLKRCAVTPEEKEHVTLYLLHHPDQFSLHSIVNDRDLSENRWTVDTPEDFLLVQKIIEALYPTNPQFTTAEILKLLKKHPDWKALNAHVQQK